jgi:hypothetical protein
MPAVGFVLLAALALPAAAQAPETPDLATRLQQAPHRRDAVVGDAVSSA